MAAAAAAVGRAGSVAAAAQDLLAADAAKRGADASRRFSRCATHVFIAHFISAQTKLDRQRQQAQLSQQAQQAQQQAQQQHLTSNKFDISSLYARPGLQPSMPSAVKLVNNLADVALCSGMAQSNSFLCRLAVATAVLRRQSWQQ
jgi:hypothetical protein